MPGTHQHGRGSSNHITLAGMAHAAVLTGYTHAVALEPACRPTRTPAADCCCAGQAPSRALQDCSVSTGHRNAGHTSKLVVLALQAEDLGKLFRTVMYPRYGPAGNGFLRLHSTYRHDLKIYTSDEGRVQTSAAAFTQGLLDLEGTSLTPILVRYGFFYQQFCCNLISSFSLAWVFGNYFC